MDQGIDLFFSNRSHAVKFVEFIAKVVLIRSRNDKQLMSHDPKSNNYNYKNCFLNAEQYWRASFKSLLSSRQLVEYIVLDIEAVSSKVNSGGSNELDKYKGFVLPDVILVKKSYEEKWQKKRGKPRSWKLKSLNMEIDDNAKGRDHEEKLNSEYEQFLRDLEENPDLRFNISLYRNKAYQPSEMASVTDGDDAPSVPLEELLADLDLSEEEADNDSKRE
ncbi:hypothetical protein FXO37_27461 [Capsicum annuum]|nr:hypothetical protein FXO37_27461 [Capsicum annuum]